MDNNFKKQILNDFSITEKELFSRKNIFSVNKADSSFFYNNRLDLSIIMMNSKLLVRAFNSDLIKILEKEYKDYDGQWFSGFKNLYRLAEILKVFDLKINNFFPLMEKAYNPNIEKIDYKIKYIYDDFDSFKHKTKMAFSFDEGEFKDILGVGIYDGDKLLTLAGATKNGKYLAELGIEKYDFSPKYMGLARESIKILCMKLQECYPEISPVYTTQFSHTKSMNLAIRAGFKMYTCLTAVKE